VRLFVIFILANLSQRRQIRNTNEYIILIGNERRLRELLTESCDNHFSICAIGLMRGSRHSAQPAMLDCRCFKGPNRCLIGQHYYLTPDLRTVPLSRLLPLRMADQHLSIPRIMPSNHASSLVICAESAETNKRN